MSKLLFLILVNAVFLFPHKNLASSSSNPRLDEIQFEFKISFIHDLILNKGVNCTDIIDYFLERAFTYNPKLNAIISFNPNAKAEALRQDAYFRENKTPIGKLHCIPTLVKDNIDVSGMATTAGIRALRNSVPLEDALVVDRLRKEGAIVLAKTNLAELAQGEDDSETGGRCNNPFDFERTCAGSSTGSGAGIAAGLGIYLRDSHSLF